MAHELIFHWNSLQLGLMPEAIPYFYADWYKNLNSCVEEAINDRSPAGRPIEGDIDNNPVGAQNGSRAEFRMLNRIAYREF